MVARTGAEKVFIDNVTGRRPGCLGTDCGGLTVQPVSEVGRVIRGIEIEDVIDIPLAGEGRKDVGVAVILGLATIRVFSGVGAFEYLGSS